MPPRYTRRYATYKRLRKGNYYRKQLTTFGGPPIRSIKSWNRGNESIHKFVYCGQPLEMFSGTVEDNSVGGPLFSRCNSAITFVINSLPTAAVTMITQNFSWYRIVKGDIWFRCNANQSAIINSTEPVGGPNPAYNSPTVHFDKNNTFNGFTITSGWNLQSELAQSASYGNFDPVRSNPLFRVYPRPLAQSVQPSPPASIVSSGRYQMPAGAWQSTANPGLIHLAMRIAIDPVITQPGLPSLDGQPFKLYVYTRYYIECKGQFNA